MTNEERNYSVCTALALKYEWVFKTVNGHVQPSFVASISRKVPISSSASATNEEPSDSSSSSNDMQFENNTSYLHTLDPKEWKSQDHYRVLAIGHLRYNAAEDTIKAAYRRMVLKHHPDKRKRTDDDTATSLATDTDYYTCITMAYEVLSNPVKKRSYDSVDPSFDDSLPTVAMVASKPAANFYQVFSRYFELNARWSERLNVPKLGDENSSRTHVEDFYSFWYNFKSWREYSYEDEEDKDKCQDRDERRYIDKVNKAERARKKKDEMARIRQLVDMAYKYDPRVAQFKRDDAESKLASKRAKQTAAQARRDEEERILQEVKLAERLAVELEQKRIQEKRQEREALKKCLKKERKILRDITKEKDYYGVDEQERLEHLQQVELLCEHLSLVELETLNRNLKEDTSNGESVFTRAVQEIISRINKSSTVVNPSTSSKASSSSSSNPTNDCWNQDNLKLLVKAVNIFPAGTNQRWEVIAAFLNQHMGAGSSGDAFNSKTVLAKAKDLQNSDFTKNNLKDTANKIAIDSLRKTKRNVVCEGENENNSRQSNGFMGLEEKSLVWTTLEQQLLEQALKSYPAASTPNRWDRIADCIPNRTKKECLQRYKELVETVKAKKAAQTTVCSTKC